MIRYILSIFLSLVLWSMPLTSVSLQGERRAPIEQDLIEQMEDELLLRHAPVVLLAPGESALPANVDWYLARTHLVGPDQERIGQPAAVQAGLVIDLVRTLGGGDRQSLSRLRPLPGARAGSQHPSDWVTYGHVFASEDGGVLVQYWFFYPFNRAFAFFDHDGDWEHITVRLGRDLRPMGAWYARHAHSAPGKWFDWTLLPREGDHPIVLSARGTHASYVGRGDGPFWEPVCPTRDPAWAERRGCRVWRTSAPGSGGITSLGSLHRPREGARFVAWPGRWGATGTFWRASGGPLGPAFQRAWCSGGTRTCS